MARIATDPQFVRAIDTNIVYWRQFVTAHQNRSSLNIEHEGLLRAAEFGLAQPETQVAATHLTLAAFSFILHRGHWQPWLPLFAQAGAACRERDVPLFCQLWNRYGQLLRLTRQLDTAVTIHQEAETAARNLDDDLAVAEAQFNLSEDYRHRRQYDTAETYGLKALQAMMTFPDTHRRQAAVLNNLGLIALEWGRLAQAEERLTKAVSLWRLADDPTELARSLHNLAVVWQEQAKFEAALTAFHEAATELIPTTSDLDKSRVQLSIGAVYFQLERFDKAEAAFKQADTPALQQSGDQYTHAILAQSMGNTLLKQKRYAQAEIHLRCSLNLWQTADDRPMLANTMGTLAEALAAQKDDETARELYEKALVLLADEEGPRVGRLRAEFTRKRQALD